MYTPAWNVISSILRPQMDLCIIEMILGYQNWQDYKIEFKKWEILKLGINNKSYHTYTLHKLLYNRWWAKYFFYFQPTNYAFFPLDHKASFWFYSRMPAEYTNPNLKSAQLEQPAPKLELDLYIPQAS